MRSIDNMREYALTAASVNATTRAVLAGYIDEIEREVEELRDRDYRNGREDAEGAVEFADRLKAAVDNREDVTLWGVDYTALPVDADGVSIRLGDRLVEPEYVPNGGTVVGIKLYSGWDHWLVNCGAWVDPRNCRHHHAPTVEDVLREFIVEYDERGHEEDELIAEYVAKLRLAGEDA